MKKENGKYLFFLLWPLFFAADCSKKNTPDPVPEPLPIALQLTNARLDNAVATANVNYNVRPGGSIKLSFNNALDKTTVMSAVSLLENNTGTVSVNYSYENNDSTLVITASAPLKNLIRYTITATTVLQSIKKGKLNADFSMQLITQIDSARKFPVIADNALLDTIQKRTFKYFWDYGHPVSGLARERSNSTPETVTSGGSGFGIMSIVTGINRNFITKAEGFVRLQTIVSFLKNTAQKFHGAFPHWLNGTTGTVIPFSTKDNGADLVETSYLMAGLLTARQYFNGAAASETALRNDITALYNAVEWDWFRNGGQNVLYWHWSPNYNWEMNLPIRGWNECLITYVLAAASPTHGIPAAVYSNGWTANGTNGFTNGNMYYTYPLPLGPQLGGPLFFSHYSFLGPKQKIIHSLIMNIAKLTLKIILVTATVAGGLLQAI
jgi:Putative glucoamylase/Bacterial Ig-like domain